MNETKRVNKIIIDLIKQNQREVAIEKLMKLLPLYSHQNLKIIQETILYLFEGNHDWDNIIKYLFRWRREDWGQQFLKRMRLRLDQDQRNFVSLEEELKRMAERYWLLVSPKKPSLFKEKPEPLLQSNRQIPENEKISNLPPKRISFMPPKQTSEKNLIKFNMNRMSEKKDRIALNQIDERLIESKQSKESKDSKDSKESKQKQSKGSKQSKEFKVEERNHELPLLPSEREKEQPKMTPQKLPSHDDRVKFTGNSNFQSHDIDFSFTVLHQASEQKQKVSSPEKQLKQCKVRVEDEYMAFDSDKKRSKPVPDIYDLSFEDFQKQEKIKYNSVHKDKEGRRKQKLFTEEEMALIDLKKPIRNRMKELLARQGLDVKTMLRKGLEAI